MEDGLVFWKRETDFAIISVTGNILMMAIIVVQKIREKFSCFKFCL